MIYATILADIVSVQIAMIVIECIISSVSYNPFLENHIISHS